MFCYISFLSKDCMFSLVKEWSCDFWNHSFFFLKTFPLLLWLPSWSNLDGLVKSLRFYFNKGNLSIFFAWHCVGHRFPLYYQWYREVWFMEVNDSLEFDSWLSLALWSLTPGWYCGVDSLISVALWNLTPGYRCGVRLLNICCSVEFDSFITTALWSLTLGSHWHCRCLTSGFHWQLGAFLQSRLDSPAKIMYSLFYILE